MAMSPISVSLQYKYCHITPNSVCSEERERERGLFFVYKKNETPFVQRFKC